MQSTAIRTALARGSVLAASLCLPPARAAVEFLGVASGDVGQDQAVVWTRAVDPAAPAALALTLQIGTDPGFGTFATVAASTDPAKDYTAKLVVGNLRPGTVYWYRFAAGAATSNAGRFKTAPAPGTAAAVKFAFSGDMDGLMRPYALAGTIPGQQLDFYVNLGDVIYENASNVKGDNAAPWLASPSVTLSGTLPTPTSTGANATQLFSDYAKKYREQFLPVNAGGQNGLQPLYAAQGNYTINDNHELGNRQYINGGAPAGGPVGGMASGAGVDARVGANDVNWNGTTFINKSPGFQALQGVYLAYQPILERALHATPADPSTDGTRPLYFAQRWGRNVLYVNTDCRSYRDIRMKTAGNSDETGVRADNVNRTMLGRTQLAWLEQTLLAAQNAGVTWKFVAVSDPIDPLGPIGGALALRSLPSFGPGSTYSPVANDGGKSFIGGYRAERNALLRFIAENHIANVVFLSTDDHQNRVNELTYSPTGDTANQASYAKVPYCFEIVAGPLGATGPDLILDHSFAVARQLADSIATAQVAAGIEPIGLAGYPGLRDVARDGDPDAATSPSPVDFYSPDTFNYNVLEVSPDGRTLTVRSVGMTATKQNAALEYAAGPQAREVFSFKVDTDYVPSDVKVTRGGFVYDRRTRRFAQQVRVTNLGAAAVAGPVYLALDGLSANATPVGAAGYTASFAPVNSPYVLVPVGADKVLSPGESATLVLEFSNPTQLGIQYTPRVLAGPHQP